MNLSDFSDLSQIIIAIANLFLAGYVLFYQIRKDRRDELAAARLREQNIQLQWFKELIVQPSLPCISHFYTQLHSIRNRIISDHLSTEEREAINEFVKNELSTLRKMFVDVLLQVDKNFAYQILVNLDQLIDGITDSIFDDEVELNTYSAYDKNIGSKIWYSRNTLIALLYNYKGRVTT